MGNKLFIKFTELKRHVGGKSLLFAYCGFIISM